MKSWPDKMITGKSIVGERDGAVAVKAPVSPDERPAAIRTKTGDDVDNTPVERYVADVEGTMDTNNIADEEHFANEQHATDEEDDARDDAASSDEETVLYQDENGEEVQDASRDIDNNAQRVDILSWVDEAEDCGGSEDQTEVWSAPTPVEQDFSQLDARDRGAFIADFRDERRLPTD
jgi:hypothetical protein